MRLTPVIVAVLLMVVLPAGHASLADAQTGIDADSTRRAYGAAPHTSTSYGYDDMGSRYTRQPEYGQTTYQTYGYQGTYGQSDNTGAAATYGQTPQETSPLPGQPAATYQPAQALGYGAGWSPSGYTWQGYDSVNGWSRPTSSAIYGSQPSTSGWVRRLSYGPGRLDHEVYPSSAAPQVIGYGGFAGAADQVAYGPYSLSAGRSPVGYNLWSGQVWDDGWQGRVWQDGRSGEAWVD